MKKPWFDNIRWGELTGWLTGLSSILTALVQSPLPERYKPWVMVAIAVVAFLLAFLRNPKSLDWVDEAQEVAAAYKAASPSRLALAEEMRRQAEALEKGVQP